MATMKTEYLLRLERLEKLAYQYASALKKVLGSMNEDGGKRNEST